jgi:hypothetical protein
VWIPPSDEAREAGRHEVVSWGRRGARAGSRAKLGRAVAIAFLVALLALSAGVVVQLLG